MKNLTFKAAALNDGRPTVNRRSTDGQSQRRYSLTLITKRWRALMMVMFLFTLGIGQMWAAETILATFRITLSAAPTDKYASYSDDDATYTCNKVGSNSSSNYALVGSQYYMKLTAKDAYVKIKLKSGSIAAGDKVYVYHNHTTNKNGVGFAMTQEGTNGATGNATANTELKLSYTLTASDIAADGSISVYRQGSNLYVGRIEVAHPEPECDKPGTPADLVVDSKTYNSATFSWSAAANSDGYKVYVEKKSDKSKILDWTTCATTSYTATDLAAEAEYTFKVKAIGASGYCELGDEATVDVTTEAAPSACPEGLSISGTKDYTEGETISLTAALEAGNGGITYTWYKGSIAAGNEVGTGASFSKANCVAGDAGDYFCVASKDACANAESAAYAVTVAEKTCPTSGVVYSLAIKSGASTRSLNANTAYDLTSSDVDIIGGTTATIKNSDPSNNGKMSIASGPKFSFGGNNAYLKIVLECPLQAGDKVDIIGGSGKQLSITPTEPSPAPKDASPKVTTASYTYTVVADDALDGKSTFYMGRAEASSTTMTGITITRPYNVTFVSDHGTAPTTPTKTLSFTLTELSDASFTHLGWTADKLVKVGGVDKAAGTALGKTDVVTLTDNTTFTATWEAKVTKHTVTYYDGETELGTELVVEGEKPTATGIAAPKKIGYTFAGWSTTNGGDATALSGISVAADMPLYAVYNAVNCSALSGTIFSLILNNAPAANCTIKNASGFDQEADLIKYGTVSGGIALAKNSSSNNHIVITTDPKLRLLGGSGKVHIQLDCALQEGDKIRTTIENQNISYTTTDVRSTTNNFVKGTAKEVTITSGHALENATEIYLWSASSSDGKLISLEVIRPLKYPVTFNMHGHGTAPDAQSIVEGGKVTEPSPAPTATGWTFGGWYKEDTYDNAWDFANDVVGTSAVELHAKWTAWPTVTLNRGAAPSGDDENAGQFAPGATVEVPACPFSYTDYNFNGWEYSPAVTMVDETHFTMPSENLTLTAQWVDANNVAQIGSTKYLTLEAALEHAADGEIVLLQDINVEAQVEIADGVSATIDLAGHKIEYTSATTLPSGVILVHNGGSLTINDSSDPDAGSVVAGEKAYAALMMTKAGDDASKVANLTINGGSFTGYYYAISGNGNRPNTNITINGGTFTATAENDNLAIYHPQNGTLTINGGSFEGYLSAIEMRAGTLVINDGSFTATATEYSCNPSGSGTTTQGAAIAIAQHTTKKDIEVTINGGTFTGVKALNESNPQANDPAPQVTMAVTAGTFTGEVSTVDVDKFVSGGSFSEPVAEANCATGYVPETKANGKYGVIVPAQSIDFMAIIDAKGTGDEGKAELDGQLASKYYDIDGTLNNDRLEAGGFKVKVKDLTISFSVEKEKVVEITTGHISGASIKVDDVVAVAMEGDKKHTYYSDDAQAFLITMTTATYNIFKSINIRDPYEVSFDVNGGDNVLAPRFGTPSVTLPDATNGTQNFAGWYTDADVFVGMNGDSYTPTEDITLVAHWEALSTVNTLSDLKVDGTTVDGFDADVHTYYFVLPYGTDISNLPKITAATATNANATVSIFPTDGPVWTEDFGGCYRQQANVTPQDPNAAIGYNDIRITIAPKDPLCIIKAEHDGTSTGATITGYYGGTKDKNTYANGKLGVKDNYMGIKLAEEAGTFKAGDVLKIYAPTPSPKVRIYSDKGTTRINATDGTFDSENMFTYTLTDDEEWIYLYRRTDGESDMNPTLGYMAVYRSVPNPLVETITFNGAAGVVDNTASPKTITVEVPATTDLATMPVLANFYSNDPSLTSGAVTGSWAEGDNEYIVTDKDGDQTVYAVTITKAVPSSDATLSALSYGTPATAIALADGVYEYNVELPYGTSSVPALAATAHHAGANVTDIDDAATFVNRHATSTVTVTAEDGTTTQDYTVNFTVSRYESKLIWDGATMTSFDDAVAAATAAGVSIVNVGDQSVQSKSSSFEDKNYTKCIQYGGATSASRNFGITIPAGKVAKMSIVYRPRSAGERSIIIGTDVAGAINESAIVYATTTHDHLDRLTADIFAGGTIYINTTNGYQVFEISLQLADGFARSSMLGNGVLGTVCVPNNVAIEDIQGVTVYELMGRDYNNYGKLAFDEIISGELEAGAPYVFVANGNHMAMLYGEDHVANPVDKGNGMYGTFVDQTLTELDDVYYFAQRALWSCDGLTELNLPANRAYVKLSEIGEVSSPTPNPARRRITMAVNGEKVATGIDNLEASEKPLKLMIDGQMYILRGEKLFDATGRLVK